MQQLNNARLLKDTFHPILSLLEKKESNNVDKLMLGIKYIKN